MVTQLVVVLATASCLVLIHLFGFLIQLHVTAQKLNKLKLREKAFLDYMTTYHKEKQLLPTLWTPPSTFQLLNADGTCMLSLLYCAIEHTTCQSASATVGTSLFIGTRREKGEDVTEPHQSCIEERFSGAHHILVHTLYTYSCIKLNLNCHPICSDNETLQTRFVRTLEQGQSDGTEQEHATLSLWHSNCSMPEIEEATPRISIETGTHSKANASKPERKAQAQSKECSKKRVKRPKNIKRDKGTRKHSCSMDIESQKISQKTKKTKRGKGDKKPQRHSQSMRRDSQDKCEQKEDKEENERQTLN